MKEIKILHLFPKLLSLYGEYGNMVVLHSILEKNGYDVQVDSYEDGTLTLDSYDLVYVGTGTEDNLMEAIRRLMPYAAEIKASVAGNTRWLVTGNAMTLFGTAVTRYGAVTQALGCFDYTSAIEDDRRYLGDVLTEAAFGCPLVGFINSSSVFTGITTPLLTLKLNANLGNDKKSNDDGIRAGNFYGTQLIGPVLAKNPHFLCYLCKELTGETFTIDADANIQKAYQVAINELSVRV
jgi:CobQ-like glutamine amidotransferase family enzyme